MASTSNGTVGRRETFLRDQDLVRWLENKLGSSELWGGRQAASMLTREMLVELETCFQELEPSTKMKIIQAMAHLSPKTLQAWKEPLLNLIALARRDPDDWVEAMADLFRNFPDLGFIQSSSRPDSYFTKTLDELEQILIKKFDNDETTKHVQFPLPTDSELMNLSAIEKIYGPEGVAANSQRHFTLKKQTNKFDKLLADVKKAAEQQNNPSNRKSHGMLMSSFPIKIRSTAKKLDNDLPMKGLSSSSNALKMSAGFTNDSKKFQQRTLVKRVGGAQLLDIAELPQRNKRRRATVTTPAGATVVPPPPTAPAALPSSAAQTTSLDNNNSKRTPLASTIKQSPQKMTQQRNKPPMAEPNSGNENTTTREGQHGKTTGAMPEGTNGGTLSSSSITAPASTVGGTFSGGVGFGGANVFGNVDGPTTSLLPHPSVAHICLINNRNTIGGGDGGQFNNAVVTQQPQQMMSMHQVGSHQSATSFLANPSSTVMASSSSASSTTASCFNNLFTEISNNNNNNDQPQHHQQQQQNNSSSFSSSSFSSSSNHQMVTMNTNFEGIENEALKQFNSLLKDANKLSPLSYNMIVSFLSGDKTNPLADKLGTLITLPLSESIECENGAYNGSSSAATSTTASVFLVETFFQMNYCTGEWKRLRKSRLLKPEELGKYAHYLPHQQGTSSRLF